MPKRTDIQSVLIIGAGPIIIGQACEFDYSGVQACKALREEGYKVILINSNPATIMTDPATADVTYIEPITWQTVEKIIAKERPDAILPTMGGQTALNCALDLWHKGDLHGDDDATIEPAPKPEPKRQPPEPDNTIPNTIFSIGKAATPEELTALWNATAPGWAACWSFCKASRRWKTPARRTSRPAQAGSSPWPVWPATWECWGLKTRI